MAFCYNSNMDLAFKKMGLTSLGVDKVKRLFESAFPEDERPPFEMTIGWEGSDFYGIYDEEEFVGLADIVELGDLVYLFFLAVEDDKRNQGYGSEILSIIKAKYAGRRLFLLADEASPKYSDFELRKRRLSFYQRNGFKLVGKRAREFNVIYEILSIGGDVSPSDFVAVMTSLIGEELAKVYYRDVEVL